MNAKPNRSTGTTCRLSVSLSSTVDVFSYGLYESPLYADKLLLERNVGLDGLLQEVQQSPLGDLPAPDDVLLGHGTQDEVIHGDLLGLLQVTVQRGGPTCRGVWGRRRGRVPDVP